MEAGYSQCVHMGCFDNGEILGELVTSYKETRTAAAACEECLDISPPDANCIQSSVHAQAPRIDVSKLRWPESVAFR